VYHVQVQSNAGRWIYCTVSLRNWSWLKHIH